MNLADAIRKAAQTSGAPLGQPEVAKVSPPAPTAQQPQPAQPVQPAQVAQPEPAAKPVEVKATEENILAKEQEQVKPLDAQDVPHGHNVVRLELVLNPEQLKGFFGAVIASQHSVLTLREAASFVRVSQKSLEHMAEEGNVPGMLVDGKWRFTREALEDWLSAHPQKKEA